MYVIDKDSITVLVICKRYKISILKLNPYNIYNIFSKA